MYVEGHYKAWAALTCVAAAKVPKGMPPDNAVQLHSDGVRIEHAAETSDAGLEGAAIVATSAVTASTMNVSAVSAVSLFRKSRSRPYAPVTARCDCDYSSNQLLYSSTSRYG